MRLPTNEEIHLDRWMHSPDWWLVRAYRCVRRWLGLGCHAISWKDALPIFTCSRSRKHSGVHVAKTPNGPIAWDAQWFMPPHEGLVRSPSKKEFDLIVGIGNRGQSTVLTHHHGVHTKEEHAEHFDLAETLECVPINDELYSSRVIAISDETQAMLLKQQKPRGG